MSTDIAFYRQAFLRHAPRRYAVMQPATADRKYDDHPGELTDAQIAAHLDGQAAYAVPYAENGLAHLLAFDIDAGGRAALHALMREAEHRNLFAFGQHDHHRNRGYVWIPFNDLANAERLRLLGDELIAAAMHRQSLLQDGQTHPWRIENRATNEDTRLPFARHRWSGVYGLLYLPGQARPFHIDADPRGALDDLIAIYRENSTDQLPPPPASTEIRISSSRPASQGITIDRFNAEHDLIALLISYKARPAGRRMFICPFHDDRHASLAIWQNHAGVMVCQCKSRHSACPLAERPGCDAFYIYCVGERLTPQQALRRLNGLPTTQSQSQAHGRHQQPQERLYQTGGGTMSPPLQHTARRGLLRRTPQKRKKAEKRKAMELTISEYIWLWQIQAASAILHDHIEEMQQENPTPAEIIAHMQRKGYKPYTERGILRMLKERAELIDEYNSPYRRFPANHEEWLELMSNRSVAKERAVERRQRLKQQSSQTPGETDV